MNRPQYSQDPTAAKFVSEIVARFRPEDQEDMLFDIDNPPARPNHRRMTDLNRQQVTDMLAASEAKVDARLANFDTSVKTGFAELRTDFAKMQSEMHKNTTDLIKWGVVTALGFATATVAILTFVINNAVPKATTAVASQPAPIVITMPVPAAPQAAPPK